MNKAPAFQFYPADWRKDPGVQALSRHDQSVWFDLLCIMHESDERGVLLLAGKPVPEDALARMLNLDNQTCNQTLTTLLTYGVASRRQSDGAIYSRRMVRDESLLKIRREAGKMGGNPLLLNQKPTTPVNQKPTPSSSVFSLQSSKVQEAIFDDGFPESHKEPLTLWFSHKREKGQAYKPTGWKTLCSQQSRKTAEQLRRDVEFSISNNYAGIFEAKESAAPKKPKYVPCC